MNELTLGFIFIHLIVKMKGGWLNWVVLGLLFTLLSSTQSSPIDVDYCLRVLSTEDECEWYVECLERLFQCGKNGYPIEYGYKYCKKFNSAALSPQGKIWVNATTICLKQSLLPLIESKLKGHHYSCPELKRLAFDSHPRCYTSSGFC
jgi:hypothetical protein